jgi:chemotaxis protein CheC
MSALALSRADEAMLKDRFARAMARAGEVLGFMSGRELTIAAPDLRWASPSEVIGSQGGPDQVIVGVYVGFDGPVSGHALLLLEPAGARRLAGILLDGYTEPSGEALHSPSGELVLEPLEVSALQEVGNVTVSTFLNDLGQQLSQPIHPTVPQAVVEIGGALLDAVLMDVCSDSNEVLAARTTFIDGDDEIEGHMLVLPRPASLPVFIDALGAGEQ